MSPDELRYMQEHEPEKYAELMAAMRGPEEPNQEQADALSAEIERLSALIQEKEQDAKDRRIAELEAGMVELNRIHEKTSERLVSDVARYRRTLLRLLGHAIPPHSVALIRDVVRLDTGGSET